MSSKYLSEEVLTYHKKVIFLSSHYLEVIQISLSSLEVLPLIYISFDDLIEINFIVVLPSALLVSLRFLVATRLFKVHFPKLMSHATLQHSTLVECLQP